MPLVTENFSDIITFTRNSTGTYFNSSGVLTSASTNVPRRDYNPITLEARGLLIEEQRTNLALYSAKLNQFSSPGIYTLTGAGATLTATTDIAAPDGTMTAWTLTSSGASAQIQQAPAVVASTTYTGSFWIRRRSGTGTINIRVVENVNTPLTGVTSQWQRFNFTATSTSTTGRLGVFLSGTSDAVDIWGAQLEAGAFPTSYIPTTTIALTREPDAASVNTMSPWYTQAIGTVYAEFMSMVSGSASQTNGSQGVWSTTQSALGSFNGYGVSTNLTAANAASIAFRSRYAPTGKNDVVSVGLTSGYLNGNIVYKVASTWNASQITAASNVRTAVTTTNNAAADMGTHDQMLLGNQSTGGTPPYQLNGWLRHIKYYPQNFSNTDLQTITA